MVALLIAWHLPRVNEWGVWGSNPRPSDYESDALTGCANAPGPPSLPSDLAKLRDRAE